MTLAHDLYLDQQRFDEQSEWAESMRISGITDGYDLLPKCCADPDYLMGYIEGMIKARYDMQAKNERLLAILKESLKVELTSEDIEF